MTDLNDSPAWNPIRQIEVTDDVEGGESGPDNIAPRQLAQRTAWLRRFLALFAFLRWVPRRNPRGKQTILGIATQDDGDVVIAIVLDQGTGAREYLRSVGGASWTPIADLAATFTLNIHYANGRFIAVGFGGSILTSDDNGLTFTSVRTGSEILNNLVYDASLERWVTTAYGGQFAYSDDNGDTWTDGTISADIAIGLANDGNGHFVVVGGSGTTIRGSNDGITWFDSPTGFIFESVAYGDGMWLASNEGGGTYRTTGADMLTWLASSGTTGSPFTELVGSTVRWQTGRYVAELGLWVLCPPTGEPLTDAGAFIVGKPNAWSQTPFEPGSPPFCVVPMRSGAYLIGCQDGGIYQTMSLTAGDGPTDWTPMALVARSASDLERFPRYKTDRATSWREDFLTNADFAHGLSDLSTTGSLVTVTPTEAGRVGMMALRQNCGTPGYAAVGHASPILGFNHNGGTLHLRMDVLVPYASDGGGNAFITRGGWMDDPIAPTRGLFVRASDDANSGKYQVHLMLAGVATVIDTDVAAVTDIVTSRVIEFVVGPTKVSGFTVPRSRCYIDGALVADFVDDANQPILWDNAVGVIASNEAVSGTDDRDVCVDFFEWRTDRAAAL